MTPLREQEVVERCACGAAATDNCLRCDRPLCDAHQAPADSRCEVCEAELVRQLERIAATELDRGRFHKLNGAIGRASAAVGAGITAATLFAVIGFDAWLAIIAITAVVALLSGFLAIGAMDAWAALSGAAGSSRRSIARRRVIQRFLAERPGQRLLGDGPDPSGQA